MSIKGRIVFAGIIGRYPLGGVTWCALQYIAGFQRLGYDVFYLEDTGECGFDPQTNEINMDPAYALKYIKKHLEIVGLEDRWAYIDYQGRYHGHDQSAVIRRCRESDIFVNLSGGCWFARDEYEGMYKVFIDSDPGFTQQAIAEAGEGWYLDFFKSYDALFTFALNINSSKCKIAETPLEWQPTVQPVFTDFWPITEVNPESAFTSILSWRIESFPGIGKGKSGSISRMIDLPRRVRTPIELVISGSAPVELLKDHGWGIVTGIDGYMDCDDYRRYIQSSKGELGFAKEMYIDTFSGWISDRTQCYLASGRPALVQDTGARDVIPFGRGLVCFRDAESVLAAFDDIETNYDSHSRAAREVVEEHFSTAIILPKLLSGVPPRSPKEE